MTELEYNEEAGTISASLNFPTKLHDHHVDPESFPSDLKVFREPSLKTTGVDNEDYLKVLSKI